VHRSGKEHCAAPTDHEGLAALQKQLVAAGLSASINYDFGLEVMEDPDMKRRGSSLRRATSGLAHPRAG
jgi:hypothetical protein